MQQTTIMITPLSVPVFSSSIFSSPPVIRLLRGALETLPKH
jgi:hypothetical protein